MARSLNKVSLIGNLTRDPELRYTPQGTAVCTLGLATNRQWTTESGEKKEDVEFHRIVSWNKLAELCAQLLSKGRKVYVEGRLQTKTWTGKDEVQRTTTEIVISDMIILDSRRDKGTTSQDFDIPGEAIQEEEKQVKQVGRTKPKTKKQPAKGKKVVSASKAKAKKSVSKKKAAIKKDKKSSNDDMPF